MSKLDIFFFLTFKTIIKKKKMSWPGLKPGSLRPQRNILTIILQRHDTRNLIVVHYVLIYQTNIRTGVK